MSQFATVREAKEFLVSCITAEAQRENVPLSEIERKMLCFSETGWTLPDILEVSDQFDREYDRTKYEKKIASLIRHGVSRARKANPGEFAALLSASDKLRKEDHYLSVMIDEAGVLPRPTSDRWTNHHSNLRIWRSVGTGSSLWIVGTVQPIRQAVI